MSERERWIVYPLIFFALGAAVRDKLLQRVEAKEIVCESVTIVDLQDPYRILAELGYSRSPADNPQQPTYKVGQLQLLDSEGNAVFESNSAGLLRHFGSHLLRAIDSRSAGNRQDGERNAPAKQGTGKDD